MVGAMAAGSVVGAGIGASLLGVVPGTWLLPVLAAILVVSAPDSVQPQTHEHLLLARTLGIDRKTLDGHIAAAIRNLAKHDDFDPLPWLATAMKDTRCA